VTRRKSLPQDSNLAKINPEKTGLIFCQNPIFA